VARTRVSAIDLMDAAIQDLATAIQEVGPEVERKAGSLVLSLDRNRIDIEVVAAAYATSARVRELIDTAASTTRAVRVLVSDRITADARAQLEQAGWGYLDRRGHLRLPASGLLIDTDVRSMETHQPAIADPIMGRAGLAVAYRLLTHSKEPLRPTHSGTGFAPSTVSVALQRIRDAGLLGSDGRALVPELFWVLAGQWSPDRWWLLTAPDPSEAAWHDPTAAGWCLSGTLAAVELGAPITTTTSICDLYVPGPVDLTIAARRYGVTNDPNMAAASIAVAPVAEVTAHRRPPLAQDWPLAHPVAVALDLAQDQSRGPPDPR
jgi:hypothetical protein